jgi:hypothetical protein
MFAALGIAGLLTFQQAAGTPPEPGQLVYEESLSEPGLIRGRACPTGRGRAEMVGEGLLFAIQGRCMPGGSASLVTSLDGLTVPDGELSVEFKIVNGFERIDMALFARGIRGEMPGDYIFGIAPERGRAFIAKDQTPRSSSGEATTLVDHTGLKELFHRNEWNTLTIRLYGPELWLFINSQLAVSAADDTLDTGTVSLGVGRQGNPNDDQEVAVVFRNLRVSTIVGAPDKRAPTYAPLGAQHDSISRR